MLLLFLIKAIDYMSVASTVQPYLPRMSELDGKHDLMQWSS